MPIVSGNVSLYNESVKGPVDPSAIIACLGRIQDYNKAITMEFKKTGSSILLIGQRKDELGGSVYYQIHNELGANVPKPDFKEAENQIYAVTDMIDNELLLACHDISDGGLAVALAEMCFGGNGKNKIGCEIEFTQTAADGIYPSGKLFSETGGFVLETKDVASVQKICEKYNIEAIEIGKTGGQSLKVATQSFGSAQDDIASVQEIINLSVQEMADKWLNGLRDKMNN